MPRPAEFRRRAAELARLKERLVAQLTENLGISGACLRGRKNQADLDEERERRRSQHRGARRVGELRRQLQVPKLESEILKHAAAYFAAENVLPG